MCSFHREKIRFSLNALACLLLLPLAVHAVVTPPPPEGAAVTNHGKVAGSSKEITRSQSESGAINTVLVTAAQDLNPSAQELDTDGTFGRGGGDEKCCEGAKCDGDANGDGVVDPLDQGYILSRFGVDPSIKGCTADVNCDGVIDPLDAGYSLARFGTCLAPTLCAQGGGACGKSAPKMTLYEPHFACCKACACEAEGNTSGDPIQLFSGELQLEEVDLAIPARGLDFAFRRTYRSRTGRQTLMGHNWDMSYNIYLQASGLDLMFFDGAGRQDLFNREPDGTWTRREYFVVIEQQLDNTYTMTHANKDVWTFNSLKGSASGKITSMKDRNGNLMTFEYNSLDQLEVIHDTLDTTRHNRDIMLTYDADGLITAVTDWLGRAVAYAYSEAGDLISVTSPSITNTPNGNDFPAGKLTTYTYTAGFVDDQLNHDLLTITDGRGNQSGDALFGMPRVVNYYAHTIDQEDTRYTADSTNPYYDRVIVQILGGSRFDFVYKTGLNPDDPANLGAVTKATVNDRLGHVKESFFNTLNQTVAYREYTGLANPVLPTDLDLNINVPTGKIRSADPDYFETIREWSTDSLLLKTIHPNLNTDENTYDSESPSRRSQCNRIKVVREPGPLGGDQTTIVKEYKYDDDFGSCCGLNFAIEDTDARGNKTFYDRDENGNAIKITHRIDHIIETFEYNGFGQMTAHVLPDNGSAYQRRDERHYYTESDGSQNGYLKEEIVDFDGLKLNTTHEYDGVGNEIRTVDPRGHDTQRTFNALNQVVRRESREVELPAGANPVRYKTDTFFDANNNVARVDVDNVDESGVVQANDFFTTIYEYDILNDRTRSCQESGNYDVPIAQFNCTDLQDNEFITTEYEYDANKNRTFVRYGEAVEGRQTTNGVGTLYDERDLVFQVIRAEGDPDQSTNQYDYDLNRNLRKVQQGIEDTPRPAEHVYDGYDRRISTTDPMGNVGAMYYDANDNIASIQTDGELVDAEGIVGNIRLSKLSYEYDAMDRRTFTIKEFFDTETQVVIGDGLSITETQYSDNSQVSKVKDDNGHDTDTVYDTANRVSQVTDALGNMTEYAYDANSNIISMTEQEKSELNNSIQSFITSSEYDNLDRPTRTTDSSGNMTIYRYDSRGNRTEMEDALGVITRYVFDGLNRLVQTTMDLDRDGADGDGADIVTTQTFDDDSRLVIQRDDNGNATVYAYDPLNRRTAITYADDTAQTTAYDVHDNAVTTTDANGSVVIAGYDLNNRLTSKSVTPGAGVSNATTFETFQYEGRGLLITAQDDDSTVTRTYDSMSNVALQTLTFADDPSSQHTVASTYDGEGNKLTCTYPGGRVITTTYGGLNHKKSISDQSGQIAQYFFIGPDRVEQRDYGNGTLAEYLYDGVTGVQNPPGDFGVRRIVETKHSRSSDGTIIDHRAFTWDKMMNKIQRTDLRLGGPELSHAYGYDDAYRLVHTTVADPDNTAARDTDYELDGVHNRIEVIGSPDSGDYVGTYTMDASLPEPADFQTNQYTTTASDARMYDLQGNMTHIDDTLSAQRDITYDYRNQMVENVVVATGERHTYAYDALGRRIRKVVDADGGAFETRFLLDGWQEIEEQDKNGDTQATYAYGLYIDEVLNMQRDVNGNGVFENYYYHTDDLYNVMAVTDGYGNLVEGYEYLDYGQPAIVRSLAESEDFDLAPNDWSVLDDALYNAVGGNMRLVSSGEFFTAGATYFDAGLQTSAFEVEFDFRMSNPAGGVLDGSGDPDPDGLAFVVTSTPPLQAGFNGYGLGYEGFPVDSFAVEFDTFHNFISGQPDDPDGNHVGLDVGGSVQSLATMEVSPDLDKGSSWHAHIRFVDGVVTVILTAPGGEPMEVFTVTVPASNIPGTKFFGFSSGTGANSADTDVDNVTITILDASPQSAIGNRFLFTGREYDAESGWYYYRTRYLDPVPGKFVTRDPTGIWNDLASLGGGTAYAGNNPGSFSDPYGTISEPPSSDSNWEYEKWFFRELYREVFGLNTAPPPPPTPPTLPPPTQPPLIGGGRWIIPPVFPGLPPPDPREPWLKKYQKKVLDRVLHRLTGILKNPPKPTSPPSCWRKLLDCLKCFGKGIGNTLMIVVSPSVNPAFHPDWDPQPPETPHSWDGTMEAGFAPEPVDAMRG